ncbi:hypothetical protein B7494_g737 [Chlorociboria aeruginascens]|nr:hypothetical protein B7494_g737 [Chlorociboria aeruginascens]
MKTVTTRQVYRRDASRPNTLYFMTEALPPLRGTEILIRIHAISLNFRDANILSGMNPWPVAPSGIPCSDGAGEVVALGRDVRRFKIGDRVSPIFDQVRITGQEQRREWLGGEVDGVLATHVIFSEERVVLIPEHLTWAEAACLPCAGLTAWTGLVGAGGDIITGKTVLLQGTGGVSLMALKLAIVMGCKVIITSSSDAKLERVWAMVGGNHLSTINYTKIPNWCEEAIRLNCGQGVDIVLDNGGTSSLLQSVYATAKRGIISLVGYLGNQDPRDLEGLLPTLIDKTITLRGINVGSRQEFEALNRTITANDMTFEDVIDKSFTFDYAEEAFKYLKSQKHVGKVVIEFPSI